MRESIRLSAVTIITVLSVGLLNAQDYVGSQACASCHGDADVTGAGYNIHATFMESGHPYKLNPVSGASPDYPWSSVPNTPTNVYMEGGVDTTDFTWDDVNYVIGGYGWKARFIDNLGYIVTGYNVQYNLETEGWGKYHQTEAIGTKKYNCGRCHTTGWVDSDDEDPANNQDGLEGLVGTFSEPGVRCEACHGPGSDHVQAPSTTNITLDSSSELCGNCHYRDGENRIEYKSGFIRHHEQYDEMLHSPHYASLTCNTCHNSHASTVYDDQALGEGVKMECSTCHPTQATNMNHNPAATCTDCHMPEASKSAVAETIYNGDVKTHIFRINTAAVPMDSMVYVAENGKSYVRTDADGIASVTLDYACYSCHNDETGIGGGGSTKTLAELSTFAELIHVPQQADNYIGSEACLSCHSEKSGWRTSLHANGFSVPLGENSLVDLYGVVADADQNSIDDFIDGLDMVTTDVFSAYGTNAPKLGYDAQNDEYTVTIGELTMPVKLTYGGSGLYKQRYVLKIPVADGGYTASHYVSPIQYNEKTDEYVLYHPEAWYTNPSMGDYTPLFDSATTKADIVATANIQKRSFEKNCVGCHFTYTEASQTVEGEWIADAPDAGSSDTGTSVYDIDGDGTLDLIDTGCERCHGPGGNHFGDPAGIVNPANLTAQQANDLCGFCHSRGKSYPNETLHYPYDDANMHDWDVGDAWGDYYIDGGGYYPDGMQGENEKRNSKKHHQQYFDLYESAKPTFMYHEIRCYECHDIHNDVKHHIREEIVEDDIVIATENDNNTLCLACHSTHGYFEDLTPEMIADPVTYATEIATVVSAHTHHEYDPENGPSRCSKCHMPKTIKSAIHYDIHSHTFEPISPQKTLEYEMPNACAASCHRGIENGATPIFNVGVDASLSDWSETTDIALADTLTHYFGPGGVWWDVDQILSVIQFVDGTIPDDYSLLQNYPNPFNPSTVIPIKVSNEGNVKVVLFNLLGEEVAVLMDKYMTPGKYRIVVNAPFLASGVYFYRMTAESTNGGIFIDQKKMVVMK